MCTCCAAIGVCHQYLCCHTILQQIYKIPSLHSSRSSASIVGAFHKLMQAPPLQVADSPQQSASSMHGSEVPVGRLAGTRQHLGCGSPPLVKSHAKPALTPAKRALFTQAFGSLCEHASAEPVPEVADGCGCDAGFVCVCGVGCPPCPCPPPATWGFDAPPMLHPEGSVT